MGKKDKKGKKAKEPLPLLPEVEREIFQLTINDINRKTERITARIAEVEKSNEEYEKSYKKLDEERGEAITHLKRTLQEKSDEAKHLQETVDKLTKEKSAHDEMFAAKVAQLDHEFKVMREQLTGEIKILTGRLKALEHFRVHQEELVNKYKQQEIEIEEREKEHKRMLYEVEKKFIIAKDKAMKDMEVRQLQLSSEFEATTQKCIAASTKRTIRENIAVNNELRSLLETINRLETENEKLKERSRHFKIQKELIEEEKKIVMQENAEHLKIIGHLTQQYEEASEQMGHLSYAASRLPEVELKVQLLRSEIGTSQQQVQMLKQQLHSGQYLHEQLEQQLVEAQTWATTLETVLDNAATEIKNAITDTDVPSRSIMSPEEKECALEERDNLLNTLFDLIRGNLIQLAKLAPKKILRTIACSAIYTPGSLGYISRTTSGNIKNATEEDLAKKAGSYDQDFEQMRAAFDSPEKVSLEPQKSVSNDAAEISERQEESSKTSVEEITEVEPIEKKGSSVIRESSIIAHSSSILKDISTAMIEHTESGELEDILPLNSELAEATRVSSVTSNLSKKSSLRSRSSVDKSLLSQERSKVRFEDKKTGSQQLKSSEVIEEEQMETNENV